MQKVHDSKLVDTAVKVVGKFLASIMQAPWNISYVVVSADISKFDRPWLNELAP